ncbi:hypothetical protein, partial [Cupriavidus sp. OTU4895]
CGLARPFARERWRGRKVTFPPWTGENVVLLTTVLATVKPGSETILKIHPEPGRNSPRRGNIYRKARMLMPHSTPDANRAVLSGFPEKLRPTLQLIEKNPSGEVAVALVQYVASFVHPDMVCNLAMMESLPVPAKQAALEFFEHCLSVGLTIEQQGDLLRFIQPYIVATLGGQRPH